MKQESSVSPPNSVILLADSEYADVPKTMGDSIVSTTDSCVAIGTLMESDGETRVLLTDERQAIQQTGYRSAYRGALVSHSLCLRILTVNGQSILTMIVPDKNLLVEIWINDDNEPDSIQVLVETNQH